MKVTIQQAPTRAEAEAMYQAAQAYVGALVNAHRRGDHGYGQMRRDCPLCKEREGK